MGDQLQERHDAVLETCLGVPEHKLWAMADRFWKHLTEHPEEFPDAMFGDLVDDIGALVPAPDECIVCSSGKCKKWPCRAPESCPCDHKRAKFVA